MKGCGWGDEKSWRWPLGRLGGLHPTPRRELVSTIQTPQNCPWPCHSTSSDAQFENWHCPHGCLKASWDSSKVSCCLGNGSSFEKLLEWTTCLSLWSCYSPDPVFHVAMPHSAAFLFLFWCWPIYSHAPRSTYSYITPRCTHLLWTRGAGTGGQSIAHRWSMGLLWRAEGIGCSRNRVTVAFFLGFRYCKPSTQNSLKPKKLPSLADKDTSPGKLLYSNKVSSLVEKLKPKIHAMSMAITQSLEEIFTRSSLNWWCRILRYPYK